MFSFFNLTGIKHISFGDNVSTWAVIQMVTDIFYIGKLAITDFFKSAKPLMNHISYSKLPFPAMLSLLVLALLSRSFITHLTF